MKNKYIFSLLLALLLCLLMAISFSSCDVNGVYSSLAPHTHAFGEWTAVIDPTCLSQGLQSRSCTCGSYDYAPTEKLSHTAIVDSAISPTCTTTGKTEGSHCAVCNTTITPQTEIPVIEHTPVTDIAIPATCTATGMTEGSHCSICNTVIVAQTVTNTINHTPVTDFAIPATCTSSGKTEGSHCSVCDTVLIKQETIEALQHNYDNKSITENPTCIKNGTKRYACSRDNCNAFYDESIALTEYSSEQIYAQALTYAGEILTYNKKGQLLAKGSGFVCSANGEVITNCHVLDNAYSATITIQNTTYNIQSILAYSSYIDLAVVKIDAENLPYATICKNDPVTAEAVYAIGSPRGFTASITSGVISYGKRVVDGVTYIQHDADITYGNSGGPLVNKYGEVIGVNSGAFANGEINVAIFIGELDKLNFDTPLSLPEFYDITYSPNEALTYWLGTNYNSYDGTNVQYQLIGDDFFYSIIYNVPNDYNFIYGSWVLENNASLYVGINLNSDNGIYTYYGGFSDGTNENRIQGTINASTYTHSTLLKYTSYEGKYWNESSIMTLYSSGVSNVMEWFSYCLDNYIEDLEAEDFGFNSLEYQYDTNALAKLNSSLLALGTYDSENQWYEIEQSYTSTEYNVFFTLAHKPATNQSYETTFASMSIFGSDGTEIFVYINFNRIDDWGNYYGCRYVYYQDNTCIEENITSGYLDAATFTPATKLSFTQFNGMDDYEDKLLQLYADCFSDLMLWLSYILEAQGATYTLADLGFVFYYG